MPSWNIHLAHTEDVLARNGVLARALCDRNAFLFGGLVPDIRVGYMVPGVVEPIPYRITHFAKPEHIPKPREHDFWVEHVEPLLSVASAAPVAARSIVDERERINQVHFPERSCGHVGANPAASFVAVSPIRAVSATAGSPAPAVSPVELETSRRDMVLGAWSHLVADNIWNTRVHEYLATHGGKPSESFRIKKQGDFDWFGRTRGLSLIPVATARLVEAAARFPQYPIERDDVLAAVGVAHETVRVNEGAGEHPPYQLLSDDFFDTVFAEVGDALEDLYTERTVTAE